jgi:hypothetical protein
VFNGVVGGVQNEVMGGVRRRRADVRSNVLVRLLFELRESAHTSAVSHRTAWQSPGLRHQISGDAFAGVTVHIHRAAFALPAKAMAHASALFGDGSPRLRMSSFDSILIRPRESMPHLVEPS